MAESIGPDLPGNATPEETFRVLFTRYHRAVRYFFARRGLSPEESEDLTQETFLRVFRSSSSLRDETRLQAWIFTVATNLLRNEIRSRNAQKRHEVAPTARQESPESDTEEVDADAMAELGDSGGGASRGFPPPLGEILADERLALLRRSVDALPAQMRRYLLLRIDQGLRYREIAGVMGVSINTVKSQLSQASRRLRSELAGHFPDIEID